MKKHLTFLFLPLLVFGLASCNIYDLIDKSKGPGYVPPLTSDGHYTLEDPTPFSYRDLQLSAGMDALPSTGEYDVLVLPIELSDFPFEDGALEDLDVVLNSEDGTDYWESLSSFYYKSSYGQLKVNFVIADVYESGLTAEQAYARYGTNTVEPDNGISLIDAAFKNYKNNGGKAAKFDYDSNGWVDGIVAVYSCPDSQSYEYPFYDATNFYWAYTYWSQQTPNYVSPSFNLYFWLSIDFIYTDEGQLDAHTLIHEFGHMLGLDDYYPSSTSKAPYNAFFPVGWLDMMDGNILDHDAFSKLALGWIKPTVITDSCTVELKPLQDGANAIVLPSGSWNGTAFDEYLRRFARRLSGRADVLDEREASRAGVREALEAHVAVYALGEKEGHAESARDFMSDDEAAERRRKYELGLIGREQLRELRARVCGELREAQHQRALHVVVAVEPRGELEMSLEMGSAFLHHFEYFL